MDQIFKPASRIEKLMAKLCPNGVTFRELGDIARYSERRIPASELNNENYVGVDNLLPDKRGKISSSYVPKSGMLARFEVSDVLLGNIRPYLKKVWLATHAGGTNGDVLAIQINEAERSRVDPRFLYFVLSSESFFSFDVQHSKGTKMPRGNKAAILKFHIPIPPLEIQHEIVNVLDNFTELETELETKLERELEARRIQYGYYRDSLLAFAGQKDVRWAAMGEIGEFVRGRRFTKDDVVPDGISSIHYGEIYTHYRTSATSTLSHVRAELAPRLRFALPGDVIIAAVGETVEDVCKAVAWLGDGEVAVHDDCFMFRHSMNPKFVSYWFQTAAFHAAKNQYVARAKVKRISGESLSRIAIPVPSAQQQERIVSVLDKFEALVDDVSTCLPAELSARRKQYEHYRNKLLTFPEYVPA
jgi:type I restriction enzyme S subunit